MANPQTTNHDPLDDLLISGSVKDTLDRVNDDDDEFEWIPSSKSKDASQDEPRVENNKTKHTNTKQSDEKKKDKVLPTADRKENEGRKSAKAKTRKADKDSHSPAKTQDGSDWENFLLRLDERKKRKKSGKTRVVLMPEEIINASQTIFGKHSADVFSQLFEDMYDNNKENIMNLIMEKSDPKGKNKKEV